MNEPASAHDPILIQERSATNLAPSTRGYPPAAVLDTHIVLDRVLFGNPAVLPLFDAIGAGRITWLATTAMRAELERMLRHTRLAHWNPDPAAALSSFDAWSHLVTPSGAVAPAARLRCTDADDQIFIDTALDERARWLFTRDRALLKLARRARRHGLAIQPPERWVE